MQFKKTFLLGILLFFFFFIASFQARAATLPSGFTESVYVSGFKQPSAMEFAPDGRLFICEQSGALRVVKAGGTLLSTPFVNLAPKISSGNERGLLGIAFDPNFITNHYVYVFYTAASPAPHNRVSRFTANGDVAVAGSERVIFDFDNLGAAENHNGGGLHFGVDGKLYAGHGDNKNFNASQSLSSTHGKIHRLNADPTNPIPSDNPFYTTASGNRRAIYALGFRNPFTFAIQPGTGRIFVNDVGEGTWEEVNDLRAGKNYGWSICEGACSDSRFVNPIYAYSHSEGCAVTGGTFYNPSSGPALTNPFPSSYTGRYFFADDCNAWVRVLNPTSGNTVTTFATGFPAAGPVDLDVGPDGSLYLLVYASSTSGRPNAVRKVRFGATLSQPPAITTQPSAATATVGQTATFSVNASGTAPLSYQWQKNNVNITTNGASASYTTSATTLTDNSAQFRCVVTNALGSVTSNQAILTVTTNRKPTATIVTPLSSTQFIAGQPVSFSGTGIDPEDGVLPPSAFTWDVDFGHNDTGLHYHPFDPPVSGIRSGTFLPSQTDEVSPNVWYRIFLKVTDSAGMASDVVFLDVFPVKSTMTFTSTPPGLQLLLDGQPFTAPKTVVGVAGVFRTLNVVSPQTVGGVRYQFSSWSDAGVANHTITTPTSNAAYTATFVRLGSPPASPTNLRLR